MSPSQNSYTTTCTNPASTPPPVVCSYVRVLGKKFSHTHRGYKVGIYRTRDCVPFSHSLNRIVLRTLEYKKAVVKKDVIGLPVGDGMVQVLFLL